MPFVFALSCKKDPIIIAPLTLPPKIIDTDTADFTCHPYIYSQFTKDSFPADPAHLITSWEYNPGNPNEMIYILNVLAQKLGHFNELWRYNFLTKARNHITDNVLDDIATNKKGWVAFRGTDWNVYKIKVNGDSLTELTFNNNSFNPKWDYTDTALYVYNDSPVNLTVKLSRSGKRLDSITGGGFAQAFSKTKDWRAYRRVTQGSNYGLFIMDMSTKTETLILEGDPNELIIPWCFDNQDNFIYGNADSAIIRTDVNYHTTEIFKKFCPNSGFGTPHVSFGVDKLTCGWEKITQIILHGHKDIHEYRAMEFDLNDPTRKPKEVKPYK